MMYPLRSVVLIFCAAIMIAGCSTHTEKLVTERIVYDVALENADPGAEWWENGLPGPYREKLINRIMEDALSGRVSVFSSTGKKLSLDEIKKLGTETVTITLQHPDPPYDTYDTTITRELDRRDISRIRFLEEWYYDQNQHLIRKEVVGMAPMMESYDPEGNLRGFQALFWVFKDEKVPGYW